jgi:hypothetical protein
MLPWLQVLRCCAGEALIVKKSSKIKMVSHLLKITPLQSNAALLAIFDHA